MLNTRDAGTNAEVTANMVDASTAVVFMLIPLNMKMPVSSFKVMCDVRCEATFSKRNLSKNCRSWVGNTLS